MLASTGLACVAREAVKVAVASGELRWSWSVGVTASSLISAAVEYEDCLSLSFVGRPHTSTPVTLIEFGFETRAWENI